MEDKIDNLLKAGKINKEVAEKLKNLLPNCVVNHRFWGLGKVINLDLLMKKIKIDFESKPNHNMQIVFAIKSLETISKNDILSKWKINSKEIEDYAKSDQIAFLKEILECNKGRISLQDFEEKYSGRIIDKNNFKSWIESTKRKIKKENAGIFIPVKKNEFIELAKDDSEFSTVLTQEYYKHKDFKKKFTALTKISKNLHTFENEPELLSQVLAKVNEYLNVNKNVNILQSLELIFLRDEIIKKSGYNTKDNESDLQSGLSINTYLRENSQTIINQINDFGLMLQRKILNQFPDAFNDEWLKMIIMVIKKSSISLNNELFKIIVANNKTKEYIDELSNLITKKQVTHELLSWICIERTKLPPSIFNKNFINTLSILLDQESSKNTKKGNILLHTIVEDKELIGDIFKDIETTIVGNFIRKVIQSSNIDELNRRSIFARIIKVHPSMGDLISGNVKVQKKEGKGTLIVSWESLEKRKKEYEELIKIKIPENSKEISLARSYGDLRENFEFKAAKEMQRVLMKRRAEMESDLSLARGTDFKNPDTSKVSIGTKVTVKESSKDSDENKTKPITYTLLGAWDGDPNNFIISYSSALGKILLGKKIGDIVKLPTTSKRSLDSENKKFEIIKILPHK